MEAFKLWEAIDKNLAKRELEKIKLARLYESGMERYLKTKYEEARLSERFIYLQRYIADCEIEPKWWENEFKRSNKLEITRKQYNG